MGLAGRLIRRGQAGEVVFLVALIVLQGVLLRESLSFEPVSRRFPLLFAAAGLVLCVGLGTACVRVRVPQGQEDREALAGAPWHHVAIWVFAALISIYVLGVILALALLLFVLPGTLGDRRGGKRAVFSVAVAGAFWLFCHVMGIPLQGSLLVRAITAAR